MNINLKLIKYDVLNKLLTILVLFITSSASSQVIFQKTYGGSGPDIGYSVLQASDGGYVLFGQTWSFGSQGIYFVKTDDQGIEQWYKTYSGGIGFSIQHTLDGGYILCGNYTNDSLAIIKTDTGGNLQWYERYKIDSNSNLGAGYFARQTTDSGFVMVGISGYYNSSSITIIRTNNAGQILWSKIYPSTGREIGASILQTNDSGFAIFGETNCKGFGSSDMYLIKTDSFGDTIWTKTYGTQDWEFGKSFCKTIDNGFILLGYEDQAGGDIILIKTDSLGNKIWEKKFGGSSRETANSLQPTFDGGYIIAGMKQNLTSGAKQLYCIKTDSSGNFEWDYLDTLFYLTEAYSIQQTSDSGYVLLGYISDSLAPIGWNDMYLVKIGKSGNVFIPEINFGNANIIIYPNPTRDVVNVSLATSFKPQATSFEIVDMLGKVVMRKQLLFNGKKVTIGVNELPNGIYLIKIFSSNVIPIASKFVISRN